MLCGNIEQYLFILHILRGINMPAMKNGFVNNILSNNACDIESSLFWYRIK